MRGKKTEPKTGDQACLILFPVEILPLTASANAPAYPAPTRPFGGNMNINLERH